MKFNLSLSYCRLLVGFSVLSFLQIYAEGLRCHQCNGWNGDYPPAKTGVSTCTNRNNQCSTTQFCVKVVDPMNPGVDYVTFKSDCYYQTTLQVNPTNLSSITSGGCFPYQDGSNPAKRWWYCFCNDHDFCNHSSRQYASIPAIIAAFLISSALTIF